MTFVTDTVPLNDKHITIPLIYSPEFQKLSSTINVSKLGGKYTYRQVWH